MENDILEETKEQETLEPRNVTYRKRKATRRKSTKKKTTRKKTTSRKTTKKARAKKPAKKVTKKPAHKKVVRKKAVRPKKRTVRKRVGKWYSSYRKRGELNTLPQGVIKITPSLPPENSYLRKVERTLAKKLAHWTGINYDYVQFIVSRNRYTKRYEMKTSREKIAMNKRRGLQTEYFAVYMCQSFGFDAKRVPLSGASGMRGDALITLPTESKILVEVKFSNQFTSGNEKCIRFLSEWFTTLEENIRAMISHNVIAGLFFFKFGMSGIFFTAIFKEELDKIAEHIGSKFSEYIHPYQNVPFIDTLKPVDTSGKTLTVRASVALRGVVFFHTDTKNNKDREIYVFPAEFLLDWIEQSLKRQNIWYEKPIVVNRSPRRTYKRVAVPPSVDAHVSSGDGWVVDGGGDSVGDGSSDNGSDSSRTNGAVIDDLVGQLGGYLVSEDGDVYDDKQSDR